jgi:uridine kinase
VERDRKPCLIGIAGPSGAGKTELAREVVKVLAGRSAQRVSFDDYYRDLTGLDPALREERNFDHPDALDRDLLVEQLRALAAGRTVEAPVYRFDTHTRAPRRRRVEPEGVIVVDGLYCLFWAEIRALLLLKVFVEADHATCLARRLARDTGERARTEASVRAQYERTVRPMYEKHVRATREHADLVLDGEEPPARNAAAVRAHLLRTPAAARILDSRRER